MRNFLRGGLLLSAILFYVAPLRAQIYDLPCPAGSSPSPQSMQTTVPQTGHLRANTCVDGNGIMVFQGAATPAGLNNNGWYVSQNCGGAANCTQIRGDLRYIIDGTSNSTTTFTCPNSDCNFTIFDLNKTFWATTQGSVAGVGQFLFTTYVCPVTTIATIVGPQTITLATPCTANGTANVAAYFGTDDGPALATLDAAAGCAVIHVPSNIFILDSQPFLVNAPPISKCGGVSLTAGITAGLGQPAPTLLADGASAPQAMFVVPPNFNWSACQAFTGASLPVCIGGTARAIANVTFWGTGLTAASNAAGCAGAANKIFMATSPVASNDIGIVIAGICPGASGMRGFESNSFDQNFEIGAVISTGVIACAAHGARAMVFRELDCRNDNVAGGLGYVIDTGAQVLDISSMFVIGAQVSGDFQSRGTHFGGSCVTVLNGGKWISYGDYSGVEASSGCTGPALTNNSGGLVQTLNSQFKGNAAVAIVNSGTLVSQGGNNTVTGTIQENSGEVTEGLDVLLGSCRGVATSSATLGLFGLGQFSTPACTSTTVNQGVVVATVPLSGSVFSLAATAGTGCKSGNTCVFTVMKNNAANPSTPVATALTCSMVGPASFCADNTHFDIPTAGDSYSIQFTTGTTETLANVTATVVAW